MDLRSTAGLACCVLAVAGLWWGVAGLEAAPPTKTATTKASTTAAPSKAAAPSKTPAAKPAEAQGPSAKLPSAQSVAAGKTAESQLDALIAKENAGRKVQVAPIVDDLGFLRRVQVDLIGRIPTLAEVDEYLAWPAAERRNKLVDKLLKHELFAYRWTAFYGDMLRIRSGADGGGPLTAYVYQSIRDGRPYDEMCRELISCNGKAGKTPAIGFILGDNADPMALAGVTSQVFMGVRISCAECHDHPFDTWTREQFYGLAAYFGKTRRVESNLTKAVYTTEQDQTTILWPPEDKAQGKPRKPVTPKFPFDLEKADGPHIARLVSLRTQQRAAATAGQKKPSGPSLDDILAEADTKAAQRTSGTGPDAFDVAGEAKAAAKNLKAEGYRESELRKQLAEFVTNPRNRFFSRAFVNRLWAELVGHGIVNPIDDFTGDNAASHPLAMDYMADEFVASGYDLRTIVRLIVTSQTYQRGHLYNVDEATRVAAEEAFTAMPLRRMMSEALFDSIVLAGHVFDIKHPAGQNLTTTWRYDRITKTTSKSGKTDTSALASINPAAGKGMEGKMAGKGDDKMAAKGPSYDLESAIELDLNAALKGGDEVEIEGMQKMSNEELEAMQMAARREMDFVDRFVRTTYDDNPKFLSALKMAAPAPPEHFLRVFGQPSRSALGEFRDESASMRQALMMLNGKLTHEAARVGEMEPMYGLLVGAKANQQQAIRLAYLEILTREPTADDLAIAKEIMAGAPSAKEGMHDLRWVLLNCHEFRFLP